MASSTLTLNDVDSAIAAVLAGGQKYRLPTGQEVTRANLKELQDLRLQIAAETSSAAARSAAPIIAVPLTMGEVSPGGGRW